MKLLYIFHYYVHKTHTIYSCAKLGGSGSADAVHERSHEEAKKAGLLEDLHDDRMLSGGLPQDRIAE